MTKLKILKGTFKIALSYGYSDGYGYGYGYGYGRGWGYGSQVTNGLLADTLFDTIIESPKISKGDVNNSI